MVNHEPIPTHLVSGFDYPGKAASAFRPICHAGETGGHLGLESDGLGVEVGYVREFALRVLPISGEGPESHIPYGVHPDEGVFFIDL